MFDSNGPGGRIRGNATQIEEKYLQLARDATVGGDRVAAESYFQYAEHYHRIMNDSTDPNTGQRNPQAEQNRNNRARDDSDFDGSDNAEAGQEVKASSGTEADSVSGADNNRRSQQHSRVRSRRQRYNEQDGTSGHDRSDNNERNRQSENRQPESRQPEARQIDARPVTEVAKPESVAPLAPTHAAAPAQDKQPAAAAELPLSGGEEPPAAKPKQRRPRAAPASKVAAAGDEEAPVPKPRGRGRPRKTAVEAKDAGKDSVKEDA
ncbi:DUF4167 domain-containing protein [Kiloniella laminariae]|uniref:DUF4167 domain-containing protein n=1 Tax=Kiloniella laminariae TaxID=454162 RepID=UPI000365CCB0